MMHSSTIAGSMPARRTASATTSAPSCVRGQASSARRETFRSACGRADDDRTEFRFRFTVGSRYVQGRSRTVSSLTRVRAEQRVPCGARIVDDARRISCGPLAGGGVDDERRRLRAARTVSRSSAGPTAVRHANVDFARRERCAAQQLGERAGSAELSGRIESILSFSPHASGARVSLAATRGAAARRRFHVRRRAGRRRRARPRRGTPRATTSGGWRSRNPRRPGDVDRVGISAGSRRPRRPRRPRRRHGRRRGRRDSRQAPATTARRRPCCGGSRGAATRC